MASLWHFTMVNNLSLNMRRLDLPTKTLLLLKKLTLSLCWRHVICGDHGRLSARCFQDQYFHSVRSKTGRYFSKSKFCVLIQPFADAHRMVLCTDQRQSGGQPADIGNTQPSLVPNPTQTGFLASLFECERGSVIIGDYLSKAADERQIP